MLILKESDLSWYFFRAVQIQGQASKPHDGQQLCPFFRRYHLRQSNDGTLGHADDCRVFLRPHPVGDCGGTAKTYAQMEKKVQDYGAEIERMEAMSAMEARLNKPTSSPITEKPMNGKLI